MMTVPDGDFYQALGRLEGKIDLVLQRALDVEMRVRALERWKWTIVGGAAVVSAAMTMVLSRFTGG